jgi:hypothetical protein
MIERTILVTSVMFFAVLTSTALASEPAAQPKQSILHVRFCEERSDAKDVSQKRAEHAAHKAAKQNVSRVRSEPDILITENKLVRMKEGGEIDAGDVHVSYGTSIDALIKSRRDGTVELDFAAECSWPERPSASDFGDQVTRIQADKVFGKVRVRPGVVYRVSSEKHDGSKTWWEFQIEQAENESPVQK